MSVTIEELKEAGIEVGDRVRLTRTTVHEGTVKKGYLTDAAIVAPDNPAAVGHDVRSNDKIELIKAKQPELICGELYQPAGGDFQEYVYRYQRSGEFVFIEHHRRLANARSEEQYPLTRTLAELGRVKRVKLQVVDA